MSHLSLGSNSSFSTLSTRSPLSALTLLALLSACGGVPTGTLVDRDEDGYGSLNSGGSDCDDTNPEVSPAAVEVVYDGLDNDCDPSSRDDDLDEDGARLAFDCDDQDGQRFPGAPDSYGDGLDQDCDGMDGQDIDGDGTASEASGGADCDDADPSVFPGASEICNDAVVNDCAGSEEEAEASCRWAAERSLQEADRKIVGEQSESWFGYTASIEGDLDGDGLADVVAGAPYFDSTFGSEGAVYVMLSTEGAGSGSASAGHRTIGVEGRDYLGDALATGQDLDGDGLDDLVIGDGYGGAQGEGQVGVLYGSGDGADTIEDADLLLGLGSEGYSFGRRVALAGDMDGDGVAELVVGGEFGAEDDELPTWQVYLGGRPSGEFGAIWATFYVGNGIITDQRLDASGDLDGDGLADVVIAVPGDDTAGADAGVVYVFLGVTGGAWTAADADMVLYGEQAGEQAGYAISVGGDADGDGQDDLLIGAPYNDYGRTDRGVAYLITSKVLGARSLDTADAIYRGEAENVRAGYRVELGADLNGDGLADPVVGNSNSHDGDAYDYLAAVYLSPNAGFDMMGTHSDVRVVDDGSAGGMVSSLSAGDVNGDGISDLLVGAQYHQDAESASGAVFLLFGSGI